MKSLTQLLFPVFMGLCMFSAEAQSVENKYTQTVLIKLVETTYGGASVQAESKMLIIKPDNSVETKLLERASMLKDAGESLENNLSRIHTELQKWQNSGFHIQAMSSASPMNYLLVTTIVLTNN